MAEERIARAKARIDEAIRRIEAAQPRSTADAELERRYDDLRAQAAAALAELDEIIGSMGR